MNSHANCSNRPFQDTEFDPPSLDKEGRPIDYQPPCPVSRIGSAATPLKKLIKTQAAPTIIMYQSSKRKTAQGTTQKTIIGKRLYRMRPSAALVNNPSFPQNDIQLLILFLHSYQPLHPNQLWVRNYCPRHLIWHQLGLSSADPQEEPTLVETTDASKTTEDVSSSILPLVLPKYFSQNF